MNEPPKDKNNLFLLAVVAIVAIVAVSMIVMLKGSNKSAISSSEEQDLAGQAARARCTDSDGGVNYDVKGTTCSGNSCGTDNCYNYATSSDGGYVGPCEGDDPNCVLVEHYCSQNAVTKQTYSCPNGCRDGACMSPKVTYIDPTKCTQRYNSKIPQYDWTWLVCASNEVVQSEQFIGCSPFDRNRVLVGWDYIDKTTLPYAVAYTCIDKDGVWTAPESVYGYCCEIVQSSGGVVSATVAPSSQGSRTTADRSGKLTTTDKR